jgi:hypothetical protein
MLSPAPPTNTPSLSPLSPTSPQLPLAHAPLNPCLLGPGGVRPSLCSPLAPRVQSDHPPRRPPASGATAAATPATLAPPEHRQLVALGKQHAAQLADVRRDCAAEVKLADRAYTDLQAEWGRYQVLRDGEHNLHRLTVRTPPP